MTIETIVKTAAHGERPAGMTMPEEIAWYRLRDVYAAYNAGSLTLKEAAEEKKSIIAAYNIAATRIDNGATAQATLATIYKATEAATRAYMASPADPSIGRALIDAIQGVNHKWGDGHD